MKYTFKSYETNIEVYNNNKLIAEITKDSFNTEIFGLSMANISLILDDVDIEEIITISKECGFEHLTLRLSVDSMKNIHNALDNNFLLVDTLVTYLIDFKKIDLVKINNDRIDVRDAREEDVPILKEIAYNSFSIDRFHSDPTLNQKKANEYYARWIENSINGYAKKTLVAVVDDVPIGFNTISHFNENDHEKNSRVVLSAVSQKHRGKNVYTRMIYESLIYLSDKVNKVYIGTQINNYPVQRTWNKLGGYIVDSKHILQLKIEG